MKVVEGVVGEEGFGGLEALIGGGLEQLAGPGAAGGNAQATSVAKAEAVLRFGIASIGERGESLDGGRGGLRAEGSDESVGLPDVVERFVGKAEEHAAADVNEFGQVGRAGAEEHGRRVAQVFVSRVRIQAREELIEFSSRKRLRRIFMPGFPELAGVEFETGKHKDALHAGVVGAELFVHRRDRGFEEKLAAGLATDREQRRKGSQKHVVRLLRGVELADRAEGFPSADPPEDLEDAGALGGVAIEAFEKGVFRGRAIGAEQKNAHECGIEAQFVLRQENHGLLDAQKREQGGEGVRAAGLCQLMTQAEVGLGVGVNGGVVRVDASESWRNRVPLILRIEGGKEVRGIEKKKVVELLRSGGLRNEGGSDDGNGSGAGGLDGFPGAVQALVDDVNLRLAELIDVHVTHIGESGLYRSGLRFGVRLRAGAREGRWRHACRKGEERKTLDDPARNSLPDSLAHPLRILQDGARRRVDSRGGGRL
jgi:hypothetical protein